MEKKRFKKIYIEITNICNLSCDFCPNDNRKKEMMTIENFQYILEQIKDITKYIYLHVKGEPLIHPNINEFIELAYNKGFNINITTNGTLIDNLHTKKLRQINYSMQSIKDVHQMQMIIKKMRKFISDTDIYVSLRLWRKEYSNNLEILEMLKKEFENIGDIEDKLELDKNIFISIEEEFTWPSENNKGKNTDGYCYGLKDHIAILVDGTVIPCCLDHKANLKLGNIFKDNIVDILNNKKCNSIIEGFRKRQPVEEICKKCEFKNRF